MVEKIIPKKIRVGILTTSFPACQGHSQSPFIYELAKALHKKIDVKVICPSYPVSKSNAEEWDGIQIRRFKDPNKLTSGGGIPSNLRSSALSKLIQLFPFLRSFYRKAKAECGDCNILHAQWILSAFVGAHIKNAKQSLILTTRGADLNSALKSRLMKLIVLHTLNRCDYITPNNEEHRRKLLELGIPEEKIATIPNGVDTEKFKPRNKTPIRKKLGLPNDKKIILFVGWLIPRKGCEYLIRSMPLLLQQDSNIQLLIIGDGILRSRLEELSIKLGIKEYINFKGSLPPDEIPYWMNAADIFVLPSLSEGKPNVVGEAMASGLPVIATNVDGTPDFIEDGKDGFLIPSKSVNAIADKLKLLLDNPNLRAKLGKEARKSILRKGLTWKRCAEQYISIYKKVLARC